MPGPGRPRRADRAARALARSRLAAPASRARSGSAASSACSCSGAACRPRAASPASSSSCRASRTSRSSRCSLLLGSGIGRRRSCTCRRSPSLWQTSYGKTLLVKIGLLLAAPCCSPRSTSLRTKPRLAAARAAARARARRRRRCSAGSSAARSCSSRPRSSPPRSSRASPPPPKALAQEGGALARVGPGPGRAGRHEDGYTLKLAGRARTAPPCPTPSRVEDHTRREAGPRRRRHRSRSRCSTWRWASRSTTSTETSPGVYSRPAPALVMVGHWGLSFQVTPKGGHRSTALVVDRADRMRLRFATARWRSRRRRSPCWSSTLASSHDALADGDPASDYLIAQPMFLPFTATSRARKATRLRGAARESKASGFPLKVAVIATAQRPGRRSDPVRQAAAVRELPRPGGLYYFKDELLVVMPNGYGLYKPGGAAGGRPGRDRRAAAAGTASDGTARRSGRACRRAPRGRTGS